MALVIQRIFVDPPGAHPYDSGIVMSRPAVAGATLPSQGRSAEMLTVADCMAKLSLRQCRLTVFSTCESGVGSQHAGGELIGLPNSMLVAGAKSVIASLWPVHDSAASLLMRMFYQTWSGGSGTVDDAALALRDARGKLKTLTSEDIRKILGSEVVLPDGDHPFESPLHSDAFCCFGSW